MKKFLPIVAALLLIGGGCVSTVKTPETQDTAQAEQCEECVNRVTGIAPSDDLRVAYEKKKQEMEPVAELSCFSDSTFHCSVFGCIPDEVSSFYFVDYGTESGTYFVCDRSGCYTRDVSVRAVGEYTEFTSKDPSYSLLFRNSDASGFVNVAPVGAKTVINYGECE